MFFDNMLKLTLNIRNKYFKTDYPSDNSNSSSHDGPENLNFSFQYDIFVFPCYSIFTFTLPARLSTTICGSKVLLLCKLMKTVLIFIRFLGSN